MGERPLLCVFAHPDDEAFGPAGTIITKAREQDVYLVCVTSGDAKQEFSNGAHSEDLGKIRKDELRSSAKLLGVKQVFFLGFKDGSLCNNLYHKIAEQIAALIDATGATSLLTFDHGGISGHIDHMAVSAVCSYVYERNGKINRIMYYCEDKVLKEKMGANYFIYVPNGYSEDEVDEVIRIGENDLATKIAAMKAHKSQSSDVDFILTNFGNYLATEYLTIKTK